MDKDKIPSLKVGTGWTNIEIISEPDVILSPYSGYKPVLKVFNTNTNLEFIMYITASSLSRQLEELRLNNNNKFTGLKIKIRKESNEKNTRVLLS